MLHVTAEVNRICSTFLKYPRSNALHGRKTGCPLSLKFRSIRYFPSGLHSCVPKHFSSPEGTEKRPMSLLESLSVISDLEREFEEHSLEFSSPSDQPRSLNSRHEDEPIFKFFWSESACCHSYLNLVEHFRCCVYVKIFLSNSSGSSYVI